ncbi:MAG TPA: hypothetical protein VGF16_09455 [Bryobacteraceae bacterium]
MADIDKLSRRPAEYLAETGVPLLAGGLVFLLLGCSILIQRILPRSFVAQEAPKWTAICCCVAALWLAKLIKQRAVFPRGGYVEPQPHRKTRILVWFAVFAVVISVPVAGLGRLPFLESRFLWPAFAMAAAILGLVTGWRQGTPSMMWFGLYLICLAPLLWWLPVDNYERWAWAQIALGVPITIGGAIRLKRFLKAHPLPLESPRG